MNVEAINTIIKAIVTILTVVITSWLIPLIKEKIGQERWKILQEYVEYAVRCAEQIYRAYPKSAETNELKKDYVMEFVKCKAYELGLDLTGGDIELLVEGIVNAVKYGGDN